jgi:hypothetical protein
MLVTGPVELREQTKPLGTAALVWTLSSLRSGTEPATPIAATKLALRSLARRYIALAKEIMDRCLKRSTVREIYHELTRPTGFTTTIASPSDTATIAV